MYHFDNDKIDIFNTNVKHDFELYPLKIIFLNGLIRKLNQRNSTNQFIKKQNVILIMNDMTISIILFL